MDLSVPKEFYVKEGGNTSGLSPDAGEAVEDENGNELNETRADEDDEDAKSNDSEPDPLNDSSDEDRNDDDAFEDAEEEAADEQRATSSRKRKKPIFNDVQEGKTVFIRFDKFIRHEARVGLFENVVSKHFDKKRFKQVVVVVS